MSDFQISYEDALRELEAIVRDIESGTLTLEETIALYERGQALAAHCQRLLESAEQRLKQLQIGDRTHTGATEG